jgi:1-deoxy-D-xylulose-5-phosphate synthase
MTNNLLHSLNLPAGLKSLSLEEYEQLASEIREELITICNTCGGHLASNLGIVELTIALHSIFESPKDRLVFDTTHQCYVHKMLTGRLNQMRTIRQEGGLSGFAKISESDHDSFGAGHASTALSAGLGMAHARNIKKEDYSVVSIIGDASLSGGMSYEAINNVSKLSGNFICILNDNDMSISRPVGNMSNYITQLRTSDSYNVAKDQFERIFKKIPKIGNPLLRKIEKAIDRMRNLILDFKIGVIFEEFGFRYLGPIDGHNIPILMGALNYAKSYNGPIMIHIITTKGKGHTPAEQDPIKFHGVSPKAIPAATPPATPAKKIPTYTEVFGQSMIKIAEKNPNVVVITPAMKSGSGLDAYAERFPEQFFDVGIAEEHAVTFAAGLARAGIMPVVAIYSTFLQRGYDQLIHDVCLQKLPMVFALDRAGLVGEDGATHHGVFDYAYQLHIPNMTILAPQNGAELTAMLEWAVTEQKIVSIRYPKGPVPDTDSTQIIGHITKAEIVTPYLNDSLLPKIAIVAIGSMVPPAKEASAMANTQGFNCSVINLRSIKPLDTDTLTHVLAQAHHIITVEEGCKIGGVGSYIQQQLQINKRQSQWHIMGIEDSFIDHGKIPSLRKQQCLDTQGILTQIISLK